MNLALALHSLLNPGVGHACSIFAFLVAIYGMVASSWGALARRDDLMKSGRRAVWAVWGLLVVAVLSLELSLTLHDYSIAYVVEEIDNSMPLYYRITALWGGMDGSLLWWSLLAASYSALVQLLNRNRFHDLMPWVGAVCCYVLTFLTGLVSFATNPFKSLANADPALGLQELVQAAVARTGVADGKGLNPLLQTYWMTIHPPTLYTGYIGFTIPFAFCVAALITGRVDGEFLRATRRWTLWAWMVLGFGVLLGAKWAYEELGWGGYWGWDPVENASWMPWLVATAYVHSVIIQEKRGMLKGWNVFLILLAFVMTYFGTFLTRSGVVQSVHAFGSGPVGYMLGGFVGSLIVGCAVLVWWRRDILKAENEVEAVFSREATFLYNNVGLLGFMAMVFVGTMFPVLSEAVKGNKIVVGPPFFNPLAGLLTLGLFILMGIGQLVAWRKTSTAAVRRNFTVPLWVTGAAFVFFEAILPKESIELLGLKGHPIPMANPWAVALWTSCIFVTAGIVWEYAVGTRAVLSSHKQEIEDGFARGDGAPMEFLAPFGVTLTFFIAALCGVIAPEQGIFLRLALGAGVAAASIFAINAATASRGAYETIQAVTILFLRNRRRYGGYVVHLGIVILVAGIVGSSLYKTDKTITLKVGESKDVGGYTLLYKGLELKSEPGIWRFIAYVPLSRNGKKIGVAYPEKRMYDKGEQPTTEVSIHQNALRDVYTILENFTDPRLDKGKSATATIRVLVTPMVGWLWAGGVIMVAGTAVAAWPARRRKESEVTEEEEAEDRAASPRPATAVARTAASIE